MPGCLSANTVFPDGALETVCSRIKTALLLRIRSVWSFSKYPSDGHSHQSDAIIHHYECRVGGFGLGKWLLLFPDEKWLDGFDFPTVDEWRSATWMLLITFYVQHGAWWKVASSLLHWFTCLKSISNIYLPLHSLSAWFVSEPGMSALYIINCIFTVQNKYCVTLWFPVGHLSYWVVWVRS